MDFLKEKIQEEFTVGRITKDSFKYLGIQIEFIKEGAFVQHQKRLHLEAGGGSNIGQRNE